MLQLTSPLVLGSKSPRRAELLQSLGLSFKVFTLDVDESYPRHMNAAEVPVYLSRKKNDAYRDALTDEILITGDTVVINEGLILEKPSDEKEALGYLSLLSGKEHTVVSGVTIADSKQRHSFSATTYVSLHKLTMDEMKYYVKTFSPYDKAGAYGIQQWLGLSSILSIRGSYYNVMGLPTDKVYHCLRDQFSI